VKTNHWIFGADYGNSYREGSKYLLEYMLKNHPEFNCTYITRNKDVKEELDSKGIPCELNFSLRGIVKVAQAGVVFTSHTPADILFVYKKRKRRYFYLVHGQPYKIAMQALNKDYWKKVGKIRAGHFNVVIDNIRSKIMSFFNNGIGFSDVEFMSATSEFLQPLMSNDFGGRVPVKVLGMPRSDAFFQPERFENEKWIEGLDGKLIVSYLPTHRKYGKGDLSPIPFINRPEIQEWMRNNNIVLLVKQHPNMIPKLNDVNNNDVIIDITKLGIEAQVCLYHSDVLISDYSSVWIDYLLLKRPTLFYLYDDFNEDDSGTYFNVKDYFSEFVCYNEDELFRLLKSIKNNYNGMCPTEMLVRKFHKYVDGNTCERYYKEIVKH
jgi:hypothetical protein